MASVAKYIKNEDIRRKMNVVSIQERVSESNLRWFGHLCRMDSDRLGREIFEARMSGKRPRGRPRDKWIDSVRSALTNRGLNLDTGRQLTENRSIWRKFVNKTFVIVIIYIYFFCYHHDVNLYTLLGNKQVMMMMMMMMK